jgi:hypothetical protein
MGGMRTIPTTKQVVPRVVKQVAPKRAVPQQAFKGAPKDLFGLGNIGGMGMPSQKAAPKKSKKGPDLNRLFRL